MAGQHFSPTQDLNEVLQHCHNTYDIDLSENPLHLNNLERKYYELEDIAKCFPTNNSETLTVLHLNIHSLPDKFSKLRLLLSRPQENHIKLDCIILCETYLIKKGNSDLYSIPCYSFIQKCRSSKNG